MASETTSRRSFLNKLLAGTLLTGGGGVLASIVAYLFPSAEASSALGPRRVRIGREEDLEVGQGKLALVNEEPVWVIHLPTGFVAMSALCTHKGCMINWEGERRVFTCPCHNGLFDERGNVVAGLPLSPLPRFRAGITDGELYVSGEKQLQS